MYKVAIFLGVFTAVVLCLPLENQDKSGDSNPVRQSIPEPVSRISTIPNLRQKRQSYEECEKLELCMLHARSRHNFFAAYQLYFVNKENARLWDHRTRSAAECHRRYGNCYSYR